MIKWLSACWEKTLKNLIAEIRYLEMSIQFLRLDRKIFTVELDLYTGRAAL